MPDLATIDPLPTAALILVIVAGLGAILGATGRITVFRDTSDLLLTFSLIAGFVALCYAGLLISDGLVPWARALLIPAAAIALLVIIGVIAVRSHADNQRIWATTLAILTKIPFAILVPMLLIEVVAPHGETAARRNQSRAFALTMLLILTPLLVALTRDREGFGRLLARYR